MAHSKPLETVQAFFRTFNEGDIDALAAFYEPTADVLRRQADGNWLFAIDNPWGTQLLVQ